VRLTARQPVEGKKYLPKDPLALMGGAMMPSVAFFLSQTGDLIHVPDSHIATVIRDPERFGLTREEILAAYETHGEGMGTEGKARKEILLKLIEGGWIRIRRYKGYWSVNAHSFAPPVRKHLQGWVKEMLSSADGFKEVDLYMPVRISISEGEYLFTIKDLAEGSCTS
jgi:hypothetical protein